MPLALPTAVQGHTVGSGSDLALLSHSLNSGHGARVPEGLKVSLSAVSHVAELSVWKEGVACPP